MTGVNPMRKLIPFVPPSTPALLIDGKCRTYVRFKYVANGIAYFEQFGTATLLGYPVRTYGASWSVS